MKRFALLLCGVPFLLGCASNQKKLVMAGDPEALQVAQNPPPPPPPPPPPFEAPPTPHVWYGWQLLVAYAPIDFALAWGAYFAMRNELNTAIPFLSLGYGGHLMAGSLFHKIHGSDERKSTGAIFMQMGIMTVGFTMGLIASPEAEAKRTKGPSTATMLLGSVGGAIVAGAVDVGLMSWKPVYGSNTHPNGQWIALPIPMGEKGVGIGVGGRF